MKKKVGLPELPATRELKRLNDFLDWVKLQADQQTINNVKTIVAKAATVLGWFVK